MENEKYLKSQLITYIGNKRGLFNFIGHVTNIVLSDIGKKKITFFDGFSGSGAVSRFMKRYSSVVITNDMEKYSYVINDSFLKNKGEVDFEKVKYYTDLLNVKKTRSDLGMGIIERNYSPSETNNPQEGERCFYTNENAKIIDNIRRTIDLEVEPDYRNIMLSILVYKCSVHTNTSGVFKGFYKGLGSSIGKFGGEKGNSLGRIMGEIIMEPIILSNYDCEKRVYQRNTNDLVLELDMVDLVYYDPPYNQHPYGSNYHMLNTVIDYVDPQEISKVSGIPKNWNKSDYNKKSVAVESFGELIQNTRARYIMISYNNEGYISYEDMVSICERKGVLEVFYEEYSVFKGGRNIKDRPLKVTEYIFLIKC